MDKYEAGASCVVNGRGDLAFNPETRKFIGQPCLIVKRTKSGLIQVALRSDSKSLISVPQDNVDLAS